MKPARPPIRSRAAAVIGWACIGAVIVSGSASARTCPPSATLSAPMPELREALARRGVADPAPGCPSIAVRVEAGAAGLRVAQGEGPFQPVPDVDTAALLIETWVRADLIDPLLAARRGPPPPPVRPITLDVGIDGAATNDIGSWIGARVEGCIALGWICPGVRLRGLYDPGLTGQSAAKDVWRVGLGAMATGDILLGDLRLGIGVGVDVVRTDGQAGVEDASGAPLFEARIGYAVPIAETWAIEASLAGDLALWPRRAQNDLGDQDLPGLPLFMGLAGVGLRWRAP